MLWDLHHMRLVVDLAPSLLPEEAERGAKIRVVVSENPKWYQDLCADFPKRRSRPRRRNTPDTAIKRAHVQRALQEIVAGRCETEYAQRLLPYIEGEHQRYVDLGWTHARTHTPVTRGRRTDPDRARRQPGSRPVL